MLQQIGKIMENINFAPSEPYESGKDCPHCGKPLMQMKTCIGIGVIMLECECVRKKREAADREAREQAERDRIQRLRRFSNLPAKESSCSFEGYRVRDASTARALKICRNYAEKFREIKPSGRGIYLYGTSGGGKTHLAASIANHLLDQGISVRYQDVNSLYSQIRNTYNSSDESEMDYIGPCLEASLLILDDLGTEKSSEWTMATMHHIINSRIDALRPTIITTNIMPEKDRLIGILDSRTVDRVLDTYNRFFEPVFISCESFRTGQGNKDRR